MGGLPRHLRSCLLIGAVAGLLTDVGGLSGFAQAGEPAKVIPYADPQGCFTFEYPESFGTPSQGTDDGYRVAKDVGSYYRQAHFGEPSDWAGADLVSDCHRRNMRISSNVVRLVDAPDQRLLLIFGAGHLGWLRQNFDGDPAIRLRRLAELVR